MGSKDGASLQGHSFDALDDETRRRVLELAHDYRGDVTLRLHDGSSVAGYIYSVELQGPSPHVRLLLPGVEEKRTVTAAAIVGLSFSGRDTADGRSWEAWVKRWERRRNGPE